MVKKLGSVTSKEFERVPERNPFFYSRLRKCLARFSGVLKHPRN